MMSSEQNKSHLFENRTLVETKEFSLPVEGPSELLVQVVVVLGLWLGATCLALLCNPCRFVERELGRKRGAESSWWSWGWSWVSWASWVEWWQGG